MSFFVDILASFTPQMLFGMIGGLIGGLFGTHKQGYDKKITIVLLLSAAITGSAVADVLHSKWGLVSLPILCAITIPAGSVSGFLMEAIKAASPNFAKKVVDKLGSSTIDKIPD